MVENIRDTVDVILVFAGLFSAIVTTLVALTAAALQLDQPKVTNLLLMELIALQRASITGGSIDQIIPSPLNAESASNSTAETTDYSINGLWFTSLAFSLSTALIAVLVKQWIQAYVAPSFQGTPKAQAEVRHFRYRGIETWYVPIIIGLLPTFLHLSLFLFFAGLVVFLFTLDITIASVVTGITSTACIVYVVTNLLPVSYAGCPSQTPLSHYAFFILHTWKTWYTSFWSNRSETSKDIWRLFVAALYLPFALVICAPWYLFRRHSTTLWEFIISPLKSVNYFIYLPYHRRTKPKSLKDMETKAIITDGDELHSQMFDWLIQTSAANPSAKLAILSCLKEDPTNFALLQPPLTSWVDWEMALQHMISFLVTSPEQTLDRARLEAVFAKIADTDLHSNQQIVDGLIAAHKYCKAAGLRLINEETYNIASDVNWDEFGSNSAGEVFLQRFCLHILTTTAPTLLNHDESLYSSHLLHLLPAIHCWTFYVHCTPRSLHILKWWLPTPALADSLAGNGSTISQLLILLRVATFLLGAEVTDLALRNTFKEAECLVFWRRVYERHSNDFCPDLVKAFHEMIRGYINRIRWNSHPEDHLHHVFKHLPTLCLWHAALPVDEPMQDYMDYLARKDPWNPMWQEVQDSLPGLLHTVETKQSGAAFLQKLATLLQKERGEQPRPSPPGAAPADESPVHNSPNQPSDTTAALVVKPPPDKTPVPHPPNSNTVDIDNTLPSLRGPSGHNSATSAPVDGADTATIPIGAPSTSTTSAPLDPPLDVDGSNAVAPAASTINHEPDLVSTNDPDSISTTSDLSLWARARRRLDRADGPTDGSIV